jgi:hypothetical protein
MRCCTGCCQPVGAGVTADGSLAVVAALLPLLAPEAPSVSPGKDGERSEIKIGRRANHAQGGDDRYSAP